MNSGVLMVHDTTTLDVSGFAATVETPPLKADGNPRVAQGVKKKLTLEEVLAKIAALAPPTPPRDARFFHYVCGLSNKGKNPHSLSENRDAPGGALEGIFRSANTRHAYSVKNVTDREVATLIHKIYPLCYSLSELPKNRPIAKEFCLGIFCQYVKKDLINWAQFAEETNVAQRKLYVINKRKLLAQRDALYRERGEEPPLEDTTAGAVRPGKPAEISSLGCSAGIVDKRQSVGRMDSLGFRREEWEFGRKQASGWSAEWASTLATEVWELLNLSSFEVTAANTLSEKLAKEKLDLNDDTRFSRMLCESSRAEVLQMKARITEKERLEVEMVRVHDGNSGADSMENVEDPGPQLPKLESNELVGLRLAMAALEESALRHESHFSKVRAQSVLKEQEFQEMAEKLKFHDLQYTAL